MDLIVTNKPDLVTQSGIFPLRISDNSLTFGSVKRKNKSGLQNSPYFCVGANKIACTLRAKDLERRGKGGGGLG